MDYILRIKKKKQSEWQIWFILVMPLTFGLFFDLLKLPTAMKFVIDIAWILLLVLLIINRFHMPNRDVYRLLGWVGIFGVVTAVGFVINMVSPVYYLWGIRNKFRFLVFFIACMKFLDWENADRYIKLLDKLFYLNFAVVLIQYFIFDVKQDYLGGIFGVAEGNNGNTVIYMSIIIIKDVQDYLNNRKRLYQLVIKCGMALLIAAFAELKFFYIVFIFIVGMSIVVTDFTLKKFVIGILAVLGAYASSLILVQIFPYWKDWFNISSILETAMSASGYTGAGDINRLNGMSIIWNRFLNNWPSRFFGLGLGSCDSSSISIFTTVFYKRYSYLHYNWFSLPFLFLETGILGIFCYVMVFVQIYFYAGRRAKNGTGKIGYCQLAQVMAVVVLMLVIYNQSMFTEAAYMVYFVLALPFIRSKKMDVHHPIKSQYDRGKETTQ